MKTIRYLTPDLPKADAILPYLHEIDQNHWYSNFGPLAQRLEHLLRSFIPEFSGDSVCTSSGTTSLLVGLKVFNLPPGARVLLPAFTFPATVCAVINAGLTPVFADVSQTSWCLSVDEITAICQKHPVDAVLPVAAYGYPIDINTWDAFTAETRIPVLVDAAASLG